MLTPPKGPPPASFGLKVQNRLTALSVWLYRRTGGRVGGRIGNAGPIALIDHVGARSGTRRTTPLIYTRDGDDLLLGLPGRIAEDPVLDLQPPREPAHDDSDRR
jgi:hypothetical protein